MNLIAFIVLALGLQIIGFQWKKIWIALGAALMYLIVGGYAYTLGGTGTIYYIMFFACFGLAIVSGLEAMAINEKSIMDAGVETRAKTQGYGETNEEFRKRAGLRPSPRTKEVGTREWMERHKN